MKLFSPRGEKLGGIDRVFSQMGENVVVVKTVGFVKTPFHDLRQKRNENEARPPKNTFF